MQVRKRFLIPVIIFAVLSVILSWAYVDVRRTALREFSQQQMLMAQQASAGIEAFFDNFVSELEGMALLPEIVSFSERGKEQMEFFFSLHSQEVGSVTKLDKNGILIHTIPYDERFIGRDISEQKHIHRILETHKPVLSDVFKSIQGMESIALHVPIFSGEEFAGTVGILVPFDRLAKKYLERIRLGPDGYAWMLSRDGVELYCPVPGHTGKTIFETSNRFPSVIKMAREMLNGKQGTTTYVYDMLRGTSISTIENVASYTSIPIVDTYWSIVVATPEEYVLNNIKSFRDKIIILMICLTVFIGVYVFYLVRAGLVVAETGLRKQAEEALRASEERYRLVVENASEGIVVIQDDRIKFCNSRAMEMAGYHSEMEYASTPFSQFIYHDDRELVSERYQKRLSGEAATASYDFRALTRQGEVRWMRVNAVRIDWEGRPATLELLSDITERRKDEAEAEACETVTRLFLEDAPLETTCQKVAGSLAMILGFPIALIELHDSKQGDMTSAGVAGMLEIPVGRRVPLRQSLSGSVLTSGDDLCETRVGQRTEYELEQLQQLGVETFVCVPLKVGERLVGALAMADRYSRSDAPSWISNMRTVAAALALEIRRKQAEDALRESESRFRQLTESLPLLVWSCRADGTCDYVGRQWVEYTGIPEDEQLGYGWLQQIHPDDRERVLDGWGQAVAAGAFFDIEYRIRGRDGAHRWFKTRAIPIRDNHGNLLKWYGVNLDMEDLKRTEEALEKRLVALTRPLDDSADITFEELFNLPEIQRLQDEFARAACVASIITHPDGTPITAPSGFCRLCSDIIRKTEKGRANCYRSDAVIGQPSSQGPTVQQCMSGGLWDAGAAIAVGGRHIANWLIGQVRDATQTEEKMRAYAREIGADEDATIEAFRQVPTMSREQFGHVARALFTLANQLSTTAYQNVQQARFITERKQAEETLRDINKQMTSILGSISEGFFVLNNELAVTYFNKAAERLLGREAEDVLGQNLFEAFPEAKGSIFEEKYTLAVREKRSDTFEAYFGAKPYENWYDVRIYPYQDGISVYFQVTTARKRAEEEREKLQAQLNQAQKMESVGRLAGGVAHDFNNMLAIILGHTEMAMDKVDPAQPLFADLREIRKAAERSADLTRQLLAFARKQTVAPKVLDLNETVEGMLKMLRRLIGEDIDFAWVPARQLCPVKMDPSQIDQILANLCVNARDAIAGLGKVTIETGTTVFDEAYCSEHLDFLPGDYVLLAVSDDGCGMDKDTLDRLFEPFFTTKGIGKGTGLGLATVYGIVKQNNGFVNVYSEPGKGTTFKIYLPRHKGKSEQVRKEGPAEPAVGLGLGHETILLVEDEPVILQMTAKMLELMGYTVVAASRPGEAIRVAEAHPGEIHLLMTDVIMPEMNGRDLARNLLSLFPNLKRLFMSGYTANVIAHHGVLDPGVHFIQKPFSINDLANKVKEVLADNYGH